MLSEEPSLVVRRPGKEQGRVDAEAVSFRIKVIERWKMELKDWGYMFLSNLIWHQFMASTSGIMIRNQLYGLNAGLLSVVAEIRLRFLILKFTDIYSCYLATWTWKDCFFSKAVRCVVALLVFTQSALLWVWHIGNALNTTDVVFCCFWQEMQSWFGLGIRSCAPYRFIVFSSRLFIFSQRMS